MTLMWEQVVVDCQNPAELGRWWADALGWQIIGGDGDGDGDGGGDGGGEGEGESEDGEDGDEGDEFEVELANPNGVPNLLFLVVPEGKTIKNRLHLDFVPGDQAAEVARLEGLGARRDDIGQGETTWVVMADPEGNEFCVLSARP